ncbi:MAG TPA: hypothetical protein VGD81_11420 [Opitutaceae bacterium]
MNSRLLRLLCCLALAPLASAATFTRLFEIAVVRFVPSTDGQILARYYLLNAKGELRATDDEPVPASVTLPDHAFDRVVILSSAWLAYRRLGPEAVANFAYDDFPAFDINGRGYHDVAAREDAKLDVGPLVNLSARAQVSPGLPVISGFVIHDEARTVLIRAVGPTLAGLGVPQPLADPILTLFKGSTPHYENDDWSTRPDAAEIVERSKQIGAFALPAGSKDAALLLELPPGQYTAHARSRIEGPSGEVLLEIYAVP